ncbi:MAG: hypothetical protein ACRDTC_22735 [Pseudonocardiaceae bacterium]
MVAHSVQAAVVVHEEDLTGCERGVLPDLRGQRGTQVHIGLDELVGVGVAGRDGDGGEELLQVGDAVPEPLDQVVPVSDHRHTTVKILSVVVVCLLLLSACGGDNDTVAPAGTAEAFPRTVTDCGRDVVLDKRPERVLTRGSVGSLRSASRNSSIATRTS